MSYFGIKQLNELNNRKIESFLVNGTYAIEQGSKSEFIFKNNKAYYKDALLCERVLSTDNVWWCKFEPLTVSDRHTKRLQTQLFNRAYDLGYKILDNRERKLKVLLKGVK